MTLDLVTTVVKNIGANACGKLTVHAYCEIVSDMLILDGIKANQLSLDGGVIISKNTHVEKECKIEFECIHVRTTNDNDESGHSHEKS